MKALKALDRAFVTFHSGKDEPPPTSGDGFAQSLRALAEESGKVTPPKGKK